MRLSLKDLRTHLALGWAMTGLSIRSAMEYRASFLTQVLGMVVNDGALMGVWYFFFQQFPSLNGWRFTDTVLLYAITTVSFGLVMAIGRGLFELARTIAQGELDYYLTLPLNVLWHVAVSKTDISAIGDLLFGLAIFPLSGAASWEGTLLFIAAAIIGALILFNFMVITQSLAFWFGQFEEAAEQIFHALIGFTLYPQTSFSGALKVVMLTVIPAFFVATLPVQLIRSLSWSALGTMFAFWIGTLPLALYVFHRGLRRYESGNLINVRL